MSHGGDDDSAEGDLTPLLDLVLQLLMFFIINVNLATEQSNPDVKLPLSASATPLNKPISGDVYLNQRIRSKTVMDKLSPADKQRLETAESIVFVSSRAPMNMSETRGWLNEEYKAAVKRVGDEKDVKVTIHFRPDGELETNELMKLMKAVQVAGFKNIKMHAIVKTGGE